MSNTYDRIATRVLDSRTDCLKRMHDVEANNIKGATICLFEISAMMFNVALEVKAISLKR